MNSLEFVGFDYEDVPFYLNYTSFYLVLATIHNTIFSIALVFAGGLEDWRARLLGRRFHFLVWIVTYMLKRRIGVVPSLRKR